MPRFLDISRERFNHLIAMKFLYFDPNSKNAVWLFQCDCGKTISAPAFIVKSGHKKHCGCMKQQKYQKPVKEKIIKTRQASKSKTELPKRIPIEYKSEYLSWMAMQNRCRNKPRYQIIKICDRWTIFKNFIEDMGKKPDPSYSIDRIDNSGNYEPGNCRWATTIQQNRNKSNNHKITINGETKILSEWATESGLSHIVIKNRIDAGWPENRWLEPKKRCK